MLTARLLQVLGADFMTFRGDSGNGGPTPAEWLFFAKHLAEIRALVYGETGLQCAYHFDEHDSGDVRRQIAISDSHYVKFCFDTFSLTRLGIDPLPMIGTYAERLAHVHLHDAVHKNGRFRDVIIGTGRLDVSAVLKALREIHYDGWVTVEQEAARRSPTEDAVQSREEVPKTKWSISSPSAAADRESVRGWAIFTSEHNNSLVVFPSPVGADPLGRSAGALRSRLPMAFAIS